jgi:hypothetical protein
MAYVNGALYGSAARIDISSGTPVYLSYAPDTSDALIRIDPATGHATQVGLFGPTFLNLEDIAWSPRFGLIGSDIGTLDPATNFSTFHTTPSLLQIDPTTGLATKIADLPHGGLISNPFNSILSPSGPFVAGLDFSPDGNTLFGSTIQTHFGGTNSGFATVDPTTGAINTINTVNQPVLDRDHVPDHHVGPRADLRRPPRPGPDRDLGSPPPGARAASAERRRTSSGPVSPWEAQPQGASPHARRSLETVGSPVAHLRGSGPPAIPPAGPLARRSGGAGGRRAGAGYARNLAD